MITEKNTKSNSLSQKRLDDYWISIGLRIVLYVFTFTVH